MSVQAKRNANGSRSYVARVRDGSGKQHSRSFRRKSEAMVWEAAKLIEFDQDTHQPLQGELDSHVEPEGARASSVTVGAFIEQWVPMQVHLRPSSQQNNQNIIRAQLLPRWGDVVMTEVTYLDVQQWVARLGRRYKPSSVVKIFSTFNKILKDALRAEVIVANPCAGVRLPRIETNVPEIPTPEQVARFIDAIDPRYRAWATTAAYSGARFGELAYLRWQHVNVAARRIRIIGNGYELSDGRYLSSPYTKTSAGMRKVPVPQVVLDALGTPGRPDDLLFTMPEGGPLRRSRFRSHFFHPAAQAVGLEHLTPHHLRHFAISLWVSTTGDMVKAKTWAGHRQLKMMDIYAHFMPDDERDDRMAARFDKIARRAKRDAA